MIDVLLPGGCPGDDATAAVTYREHLLSGEADALGWARAVLLLTTMVVYMGVETLVL